MVRTRALAFSPNTSPQPSKLTLQCVGSRLGTGLVRLGFPGERLFLASPTTLESLQRGPPSRPSRPGVGTPTKVAKPPTATRSNLRAPPYRGAHPQSSVSQSVSVACRNRPPWRAVRCRAEMAFFRPQQRKGRSQLDFCFGCLWLVLVLVLADLGGGGTA